MEYTKGHKMTANTKRKKSVRFKQLLPDIYEKIFVDGMIHEDIAKWLTSDKSLEMDQALFTNYLKRYGDTAAAKEMYKAQALVSHKNKVANLTPIDASDHK